MSSSQPHANNCIANGGEGITARQGAEQPALTVSQLSDDWRTVAEAIPQPIWSARPDGFIDYYSQRVFKFTGMSPSHAGADGWIALVHPEDRERVKARWQHSISTGEPCVVECRLRHRSGEDRWVLIQAKPSYNSEGTIIRWFGTGTDIHDAKTIQAALARSEEQHRALLEASSVVLWVATADGMITETRGWNEITGQDGDEASGLGSFDVVHPDDLDRVTQGWQQAVATGAAYEAECRIRQRSDEYRWILTKAVPIRNPDGSLREWVGGLSDIHDRKQAEEQLRASEERLRLALHAGRMVAWELNLETNFITLSENAMNLLGVGSGPLTTFLARIPDEDKVWREQFALRMSQDSASTIEFRYRRPDGTIMWLGSRAERAGPNTVVGVTFDITDRKAAEEEAWRTANHDPLTGLPNRRLFQTRFDEAIAKARQDGTSVSLLVIDLDNFKDINDTLGHEAGDMLLKEVAACLTGLTRPCDTVARLGGDEFAVLVTEPLRLEHATQFANLLVRRLRKPFDYEGRPLSGHASIGLATFPDHDADPSDLMKDADIALYRAKAEGRNRAVTYSPEMRLFTGQRVALGRDVREALSEGRIVPFYQPKLCLTTGRIVGLEALARWRHPSQRILTPEYFGIAFDDPEIAAAIGRLLLKAVASDMQGWLKNGLNFGRVAINLSSAEFNQPDLARNILKILEQHEVPPESFEIEVTETVLLGRSADMVTAILQQFHERDVLIALDDFGTGYASLTHLKRFPVRHIKIDRSFVMNIEKDSVDEAIVAAIIGLGQSLGMQVTAEGVETLGQVQRLRELGCHNGQGYFYARPIEGEQVSRYLQALEATHGR